MKNNETEKPEGSLLWRIIFGIVLIIFALISLSRFNAIVAFLYIIISIFIFIPGRIFKIHSKWLKIGIVIIAIFGAGFINQFLIIEPIVEEYTLGQEFILPNDPNFALTITKTIKEPTIVVKEQKYTTDGVFLFIYLDMRFAGDTSNLAAENTIPFSMSFGLIDAENNEYYLSDIDTEDMAQTQALEGGELFYMFNIPKDATGLKLIFSSEDMQKVVVVDLGI